MTISFRIQAERPYSSRASILRISPGTIVIFLKGKEVLERIGFDKVASVDLAHEQISDEGPQHILIDRAGALNRSNCPS
jgi:hypothetical protein